MKWIDAKKKNGTWLLSIKGVIVKKQTESENVEMLFFNEKNNNNWRKEY